jgi:hypothetical protein
VLDKNTNMSETLGIHPETQLLHVDHMPMPEDPSVRSVREKQLAGEPLTIGESLRAGRDDTTDVFGDFETKPDHAYRTVDEAGLQAYQEAGAIVGFGEDDEYAEGNNAGVDWYLGGVALKYGDVVIEAPAYPDFFQPAAQQGSMLAKDPKVRHLKSSGAANPLPLDQVKTYRKDEHGTYTQV